MYGSEEYLYHLLDQSVDLITLEAAGTTLVVVVQLLSLESLARGVHLEGPQEVGGLLEVLTRGKDFVNQVLHANDVDVAKGSADYGIGADGDSLSANFAKASLVDELSNRLHVGGAIGNVGLHHAKHLNGSSIQTNEDGIIYLTQTKQLEDLLDLRRDTNDTADTDHNGNLVLRRNIDLVIGLGLAAVGDGISLELFVKTV